MKVIWGHREAVEPFVMQLTGFSRGFGNCRTAAVVDGQNRMVAGIVFHNWSPESGVIEVSAAANSRKFVQRGVLQDLMWYVFDACECQMVVARTDEANTPTRRLGRALGATEHIIPRLRGREKAEVLLCVTDDAWSQSKLNR